MENFNHKLKNVMIGVAATVASIASSPKEAEATINNGKPATEISKDQINEEENKESSFDGKQVSSFKEIKRILKDYKSIPGEVPMDLMEKCLKKVFLVALNFLSRQVSVNFSLPQI